MKSLSYSGSTSLKSKNGSVMVYLIGMLVFISVLIFSFTGTAKYYIEEIQAVKRPRGRAFSLNQIQKMLSTTKSLSESGRFLPLNSEMSACLIGGPKGPCIENCCQANTEIGFYFKDPLDTNPQIDLKRNLSGPIGSPVYYEPDGDLCLNANSGNLSSCAYSLTSSFVAHCPGGAASCDHAESLQINVNLKAQDNHTYIKDRAIRTYYFPKVNYQPAIPAITNQILKVGSTVTIPVTGDSGHPSEDQNFKFSQCISSNESVVKIQCQDFTSGVAQIVLDPVAVGAATITIQINDGGIENFLSKPLNFDVETTP